MDSLLDAAGEAVDIADSRVERKKEKHRQWTERMVTILGIILAIPQLFTLEMIRGSLEDIGAKPTTLQVFAVEIVIIGLFAGIGLAIIARHNRKTG